MKAIIDFNAIRNFAKQLEGRPLKTKARGKEFVVLVLPEHFEYVPNSTRVARRQRNKEIEKIIAHYNKTGILKPGEYLDITRNSVYILRLIDMYLEDLGLIKLTKDNGNVNDIIIPIETDYDCSE